MIFNYFFFHQIDECLEKSPCNSATHFCVNNEGSYACLYCDKSCDGCSGDGPDMCEKCAEGYELRDGMCAGKSEFFTFLCVPFCFSFERFDFYTSFFFALMILKIIDLIKEDFFSTYFCLYRSVKRKTR